MWQEMDFVATTTERMYAQFASFGEAVGDAGANVAGDNARRRAPEDKEITSEPKIKALEKKYLAHGAGRQRSGVKAVKDYFENINNTHPLRSRRRGLTPSRASCSSCCNSPSARIAGRWRRTSRMICSRITIRSATRTA